MGKDLKGKELGKGIRQRADGKYEARMKSWDTEICVYGSNLREVKSKFEEKKRNSNGPICAIKNLTLNEWFDVWFSTYKEPVIKKSSVPVMRRRFENTFGRLIGDMSIKKIKPLDVQNVVNTLLAEGVAVSGVKDAVGRARDCMESARNNGIININPCFEVILPKNSKVVRRRFLSTEEQKNFLHEVEYSWYKELFYMMFLTGMRIGEVGGLKWSNIDFKKKRINVTHSLSCNYVAGEKRIFLNEPKTINSYRSIPFFGECESMLLEQQKKVSRIRKSLGDRFREQEGLENLVFVTSMGSPITRYHIEKAIRDVVNEINVKEAHAAQLEQREPVIFEHVYPHAIRHTFCSRCFKQGMSPKAVQALMGHSSYSTTMDIYTHLAEDQLDLEGEKFGNIMD